MEPGALGSLGVHAAGVVGRVPRQERGCAVTHHRRLTAPTATEQKHRCKFAMKDIVQSTASGPRGPVGAPALRPVEEAPARGQGTALIPFRSMEGANVKAVTSRVIFAIMTLVQLMATGALGVAGASAVGRATEGRCGGIARVITLDPPMEEELVGGQTPRSRDATLTCVLWMGVGDTGIAGACVLLLVEEAKRLGNGCATVRSHLTAGDPVRETPLRYPDAIYKHAQVVPSVPEEVLLEILMMLNLELLSLMPQ